MLNSNKLSVSVFGMHNQSRGSGVDCSVSAKQMRNTVKPQMLKSENVAPNHIIISSREMSGLTEMKQRPA